MPVCVCVKLIKVTRNLKEMFIANKNTAISGNLTKKKKSKVTKYFLSFQLQ